MNCTNLVEINLGFNHFSGNITALNFSKLTQLSKLDFINNALTGTLPINLYSCKSLKALRLATNDFEGQIQSEILQLKNLTFPSLVRNRLTNVTGAMKIFTGFKSLRVLLLSENFRGQIPVWISKFRKLEVLDLSFNRLTTGTIPGWFGTLPSLFFLLLSDNLISGEFPGELCRLQALVSQKAANQTGHCSLELPIHFKRGNNATMLSSQCNINNFSDNIPDQISNLTELERLELNSNRMLGEIPSLLSSLHFLSTFTVAYNNLEGSIPAGTQLQGFNASAFKGNPKLCGTPLPNQCLSSNGNDADENENNQDLDDDEVLRFCCPLLLKRMWRYAYFQFLDNVQFKLYLM
ncbi:receptor-like protein 2 [Pyrus ussuriensis x Pyrus communis]|uniref:Receptor-like protein 2 n=1 Tax=Pyrus ussuriensis x Pyrus communis TaxID=2448454 RepID=A0A5N5GMX2_9ROSA|nr:receptor-like protein 2 [Pyrus ussuriensis x Pyrus communis]KAB2634310.1 receptor-like protein 2 [Pyrus ussuriensis x Pyrus communis]